VKLDRYPLLSAFMAALLLGRIAGAQPTPAGPNGLGDHTWEELSQMHREAPVPPPATLPEVDPSRVDLRGEPVVFDGFVSIQVNVDQFGNNIPGDAANETSIAIDPTNPNNMVIGWRQFDTIASNFREAGYAYSHDSGQTWTFPGVLDPGQFRSDPVLDSDSEGNFYYYSLSSLESVEMFVSYDKGVSWGGPYYGFGGDKQWMIVDRTSSAGAGNIYGNWNLYYSCCPGDFTRSLNGGMIDMGAPLLDAGKIGFNDYGDASWEWRLLFGARVETPEGGVDHYEYGLCVTHPTEAMWEVTTDGAACGAGFNGVVRP